MEDDNPVPWRAFVALRDRVNEIADKVTELRIGLLGSPGFEGGGKLDQLERSVHRLRTDTEKAIADVKTVIEAQPAVMKLREQASWFRKGSNIALSIFIGVAIALLAAVLIRQGQAVPVISP